MNTRVERDVSNRQDMVEKLLGYCDEELASAKGADDNVIRMRHLDRAMVFLDAACKAFRVGVS